MNPKRCLFLYLAQHCPLCLLEHRRSLILSFKALRLALHHMQSNAPCFPDSSRGSVVLISSTSGYVGGTGVGGYVASKHGVTGLLRASQLMATELGVKVNAVAPFVTPTHITAGFIEQWTAAGLKANTSDDVACAVAQTAMSPGSGECCLVRKTVSSCWTHGLMC